MGVSLDYRTTKSVAPHLKAAIEAETQQLATPAHGWWAEPLFFFDPGEDDGRLYGSTKIFLVGYSTGDGGYQEVDLDDDSLMAFRDTCFILERLADWSLKYGVSWEVDCAGEPIGSISEGKLDARLRQYVDTMKADFPWPSSLDDHVKAVSAKYASRGQ